MDVKRAQNMMVPGLSVDNCQYIMNGFLRDLMVVPCFIKRVMVKNMSNDVISLLATAEPRIQALNAQLDKIERQQEHSSESYEDKVPQLRSKKSKASLKDQAKGTGPNLIRSEAAKAERAMLDNYRCVVLGTGNPEICHIVPFSVNDKEKSRVDFRKYLAVAATCIYHDRPELASDPDTIPEDIDTSNGDTDDDMDDGMSETGDSDDERSPIELWALHCRKTFSSKLGVSDRSWNEISLDSQLHIWWGLGYFAFEPLGIDGTITEGLDPSGVAKHYTRVKLQFHWMPRRKDMGAIATPLNVSKDTRPQDFSDLYNKTYGDLETSELNPVFAQDRQNSVSHRVQTGDIFYVKVEHRYAERMLSAFQIQWAAIRILSLAGGAEALNDVGDAPDYLDEKLRWMGEVKRGMTTEDLFKTWEY
ncbi:hypothetical protein B0T16DRAFT_492336 [Cercophora newfieldiana]|uniref:HNH nuclease domain-containing protein n=1 Tax=Cercophora newfieldiana TaxID=92897 RepID=A0AA39YCH7_9PEZI|nr:hypothetical protein B0T16DRAFT_492336 [Cercophora newfieldiana]